LFFFSKACFLVYVSSTLMMRPNITRWLYGWLLRESRSQVLSSAGISPHHSIGEDAHITEANRDDWREAARARAISEAEDAGLRGAERQKFILKRTKIYYEELEKLLGDV
jgi:hypothetical protein